MNSVMVLVSTNVRWKVWGLVDTHVNIQADDQVFRHVQSKITGLVVNQMCSHVLIQVNREILR